MTVCVVLVEKRELRRNGRGDPTQQDPGMKMHQAHKSDVTVCVTAQCPQSPSAWTLSTDLSWIPPPHHHGEWLRLHDVVCVAPVELVKVSTSKDWFLPSCLLYTSDAADEHRDV